MIVLVNSAAPTAKFLKELIKFMDAPRVITAMPFKQSTLCATDFPCNL